MIKGVDKTILSLRSYLREAENIFFRKIYGRPQHEYPEMVITYYIEKTFTELLILLESLGLKNTYSIVQKLYKEAKGSKNSFNASAMGIDEPYLIWPEKLNDYIDAIGNVYNVEADDIIKPSSLIEVLRHAVYPITDTNVFEGPPKNERELHLRLEAILKCVFPDLIHEPSLSKPIKNFRPDSGIPSLRTLIEYKYISNQKGAKRIVDEVLADRAAYKSRDWKTFLFVIYETRRIRHEKEWKQLIKESDVSKNTDVIVLSGIPKTKKQKKLDKK